MVRSNRFGQPIGDPLGDWTPRESPRGVVLTGRYVRLEPLVPEHAHGILTALAPHPEGWTYRSDEPPEDLAASQSLIEQAYAGDTVPLAVLVDGAVQGILSLMRADRANGVIEIGAILYAPEIQRTPATTEAAHLVAAHVFEELGYRRLEWKCDSLNEPSRRAAVRLGFREEGTFRNAIVVKGRNRDTTWFALTDADWPRVRAAHLRWLQPANFGEAGAQRQRLSEVFATLEL